MAHDLHLPLHDGDVLIPRRRLWHDTSAITLELAGADLSARDLRGLDFSNADLRDANLSKVRTGLDPGWTFVMLMASLSISVLLGVATGIAGNRLSRLLVSNDLRIRVVALLLSAELLVFLVLSVWKGLRFAVRFVLIPSAAIAIALSVVGASLGGTGVGGIVMLTFTVMLFAVIALGALSRAVAGASGTVLFVVVAMSGALVGNALGGGLAAAAVAIGALLLGRRSLANAPESPQLARWTRLIACAPGTSFRNADLRGARLDGARLHCTDLRGAKLDGATLHGTALSMCELDDAQANALTACDREPPKHRHKHS